MRKLLLSEAVSKLPNHLALWAIPAAMAEHSTMKETEAQKGKDVPMIRRLGVQDEVPHGALSTAWAVVFPHLLSALGGYYECGTCRVCSVM